MCVCESQYWQYQDVSILAYQRIWSVKLQLVCFYAIFIDILCYRWKYCDSGLQYWAQSTVKVLLIKNAFSDKF